MRAGGDRRRVDRRDSGLLRVVLQRLDPRADIRRSATRLVPDADLLACHHCGDLRPQAPRAHRPANRSRRGRRGSEVAIHTTSSVVAPTSPPVLGSTGPPHGTDHEASGIDPKRLRSHPECDGNQLPRTSRTVAWYAPHTDQWSCCGVSHLTKWFACLRSCPSCSGSCRL